MILFVWIFPRAYHMYQKLDQPFTAFCQCTSLYHFRLKCFDVLKAKHLSGYCSEHVLTFLTAMVISHTHNQPAVHFWCLVFFAKGSDNCLHWFRMNPLPWLLHKSQLIMATIKSAQNHKQVFANGIILCDKLQTFSESFFF